MAGAGAGAASANLVARTTIIGITIITTQAAHDFDVATIDFEGTGDLWFTVTPVTEWFPPTWPPIVLDQPDDFARASDFATRATGPQEFADRLGGKSHVVGPRNKRNPFR